MTDYYTNISFQFECTPQEASMLDDCFNAVKESNFTEQMKTYWSDWTSFNRDLEGKIEDDEPHFGLDNTTYDEGKYWISSSNPNLDAMSHVIKTVCQESLSKKPIGFTWASDCSKPRLDAFSGGFCLITPNDIYFENAFTRLEEKTQEYTKIPA